MTKEELDALAREWEKKNRYLIEDDFESEFMVYADSIQDLIDLIWEKL